MSPSILLQLPVLSLLCCLPLIVQSSSAFSAVPVNPVDRQVIPSSVRVLSSLQYDNQEPSVELQSDESLFGRGDMHLSACLEEGDVVVYQTGTWTVDGVEVGDGSPAAFRFARVENIQIVWTHNCEHDVIRAVALSKREGKDEDSNLEFCVQEEQQVEFGPEQLVARIPTKWNQDFDRGLPLAVLDYTIWN